MVTLLHLSAAFDTVDHGILLRRLETSYGLQGCVLKWFSSYVDRRTHFVCCGAFKSAPTLVPCGVPQGSALGPILFLLYTADLALLIQRHDLCPHLYADDTQIYDTCDPSATAALTDKMSACVDDVALWMCSNRLQLNTAKTEMLWCATSRRQHQITRVGTDSEQSARSVRDLGIYLDSEATMKAHVSRAVSSCFNVLRQIRSIRRSVTSPVLQSLVASLVLSRLDYGNAALAGLPAHELSRLQSVQNAGVRLTFSANKYDHVSSLLRDLHWLREPQQIEYKIAVLVYRCLHGLAPPAYLSVDLYRATRTCRSSSSLSTFKCRLKTELFSRSFPD